MSCRALIETLKEGLAQLEQATSAKMRDGYEVLLRVFATTQGLQAAVLRSMTAQQSATGAEDAVIRATQSQMEVHGLFGDLMQAGQTWTAAR